MESDKIKTKSLLLRSTLLTLIFSLATAPSALAYIDPNTGGMLFQVLAAGFAVFSGILLIFSRQIRSIVGKTKRSLRGSSGSREEQHIETTSEDT
jgi:hypothetical protein